LPERARASPFTKEARGLKVALRLTPGAGQTRISGIAADAKGNLSLTASVTAPPEGGKANAALIKLLAKVWRVSKTSLSIVSGAGSRRKTLLIAGNGEALLKRLEEWIRSENV
jgi:hypothetical protein